MARAMLLGRGAAAVCAAPLGAVLASAAAHDRSLHDGAEKRRDKHWLRMRLLAAAVPIAAQRPAECSIVERVRRSATGSRLFTSEEEVSRRAQQFGCDPHRSVTDVYSMKESVSSSCRSTVRKAVHRETGARRVVKQAPMYQKADVDRLVHEARMLKRVGAHPKTVSLVECFVDFSAAYIVMEMCFGSDLKEWSESFDGCPPEDEEVAKLFHDMAMGVQHCHNQGVLHQGLKLENFVFQSNDGTPTVRLIDFGSAEVMNNLSQRKVGPAAHCAPEVENGLKSASADVYSLGVALFAMLSGGILPTFDEGMKPSNHTQRILDKCSLEAKDLCLRMLAGNPKDRPTLESILKHPFVALASAKDRAVSLDKGLRLIERVHALCQIFLDVSPDVEPPWIMHIGKGEEVSIECMVLSGLLKGLGNLRLGPGDLIHSTPHMAATDVTVLNIPARTYASLNTAGKVGRRNSSSSASWCTAEFVRGAERRVQILAQLFLIMCAQPECLGPMRLTRGGILVSIGEDSKEAYVVLSGSLEVLSGEGVSLAQIPPGTIVGEMAALHGQKRSATLKALESTMVLPIPEEILKELQEGGGGFRYLKEAADKRDVENRRVKSLHQSEAFASFKSGALHEIAQLLVPKFVRAGDEVYREGDAADYLFLVVKGQLFEEHGDAVSSKGPGAVVGDIGLVFGTPRAATVAALTDCELLLLAKRDFDKVVEKHPEGSKSIEKVATRHRNELVRKAEKAKAESVRQ